MIIYSKWLPLGRESNAMTVWPFIVVRKDRQEWFTPNVNRHEEIHMKQQEEMIPVALVTGLVLLAVGCGWWSLLALPLYFYVYGGLFMAGLVKHRSWNGAYLGNPMEVEAYANQRDETYLNKRKLFEWIKYFNKKK